MDQRHLSRCENGNAKPSTSLLKSSVLPRMQRADPKNKRTKSTKYKPIHLGLNDSTYTILGGLGGTTTVANPSSGFIKEIFHYFLLVWTRDIFHWHH